MSPITSLHTGTTSFPVSFYNFAQFIFVHVDAFDVLNLATEFLRSTKVCICCYLYYPFDIKLNDKFGSGINYSVYVLKHFLFFTVFGGVLIFLTDFYKYGEVV